MKVTMKKSVAAALALMLALTMMLTGTVSASAAAARGDANGDGSMDMKDVLAIRKYIAGIGPMIDIIAADANGDGSIDMKDVLTIRKAIAGTAAYTKGSVIHDVYINDWANMQFAFTGFWQDTTALFGENYESATEECGFASIDLAGGRQLVLSFEALPSDAYTSDDYMAALKGAMVKQNPLSGLTVLSSRDATRTIAGQPFLTYTQTVTNPQGATFTMMFCTRVQGSHSITIALTMLADEFDEDVLNHFRATR